MLCLDCFVRFSSALDLHAVADVISARLFGGLPFVDTDEFDEVPGVRLDHNFLLLLVRIYGETPNFALDIDPDFSFLVNKAWPKMEPGDLSSYVEAVLASVEQIEIIPT